MVENNLCPSCGYEKEHPDKKLCFYCWYRGTTGAYKLVVLNIFRDADKHLSVDDVLSCLKDTGYFKDPINRNALRKYLTYLTHQGLLIARKDRHKKGVGRHQLLRKITQKGKKRLDRYNKRWKQGMPPIIRINKKKKKFFRTEKYSNRASAIRGKIGKDYDLYRYILPGRR